MKKLVIFDLDGTLAESKSALDPEMAGLFVQLLNVVQVAVISGAAWPQFEKQVLARLAPGADLRKLSILPTCGTQFYRFDGAWRELYSEDFRPDEKTSIIAALNAAIEQTGLGGEQRWGELIEDRGSQITLSALGQEAPLDAKKKWDPDFAKREKMRLILEKLIPGYAINLGGATSIDVTRLGIDKAHGVGKLRDTLGIAIADMIFVGDAIFPGGNDYPVKQAGVDSIDVRDPRETKSVVETMIACLKDRAA